MKSMIEWPLAVLAAALLCAGCSSSNKLVKKTDEKPAASAAGPANGASSGANNAGSPNAPALKTVYFAFDKADLSRDTLKDLRANAQWLKAHPEVQVKTEGRCDDRGTEEYNLALGERRAHAVKEYYTHAGIPAARLSTVSYGKDKPVCGEDNESCWAMNRQADGVLEPVRSASR